MKPSPRHDFVVNVWPESREYTDQVSKLYAGIYSVSLNHSFSIEFVPAFERFPWPPGLPGDVEDVKSCDEARRTMVVLSRYVVTPDDTRKATIETMPDTGSDLLGRGIPSEDIQTTRDTEHSVFYVSAAEFDELAQELGELQDRTPGIHDSLPISQLKGTALARFLHERILPSGRLLRRELHMLDREQ